MSETYRYSRIAKHDTQQYYIMKVNLKFQSVKFEGGQNYIVFKTDSKLSHTDENGKTSKDEYLTKSALTFLKEGGDVCLDCVTTLSRCIITNVPQVVSLIAKAAALCTSANVVETEIPANKVYQSQSFAYKWVHHEISNVTERQLSSFSEKAYFSAVDAFNTWANENML